MKTIFLLLLPIQAMACSLSVDKKDVQALIDGAPPVYAIKLNCSGASCVCLPDDTKVDTNGLSGYALSGNSLIEDPVKMPARKAQDANQKKASDDAAAALKAKSDRLVVLKGKLLNKSISADEQLELLSLIIP